MVQSLPETRRRCVLLDLDLRADYLNIGTAVIVGEEGTGIGRTLGEGAEHGDRGRVRSVVTGCWLRALTMDRILVDEYNDGPGGSAGVGRCWSTVVGYRYGNRRPRGCSHQLRRRMDIDARTLIDRTSRSS